MTPTRSVALLVTLAVVGLTIAPIASGTVASPLAGPNSTQTDHSETTNASVGTLMQASAADTKAAVESSMFDAAYETADNDSRAAVVDERTAELERQLAALEAERAELRDQRKELSHGAYRSRMAKLTVEIASLERSIERTERRVDDDGIDQTELATLRENATEIRRNASAGAGQDVAAVARGLSKSDGAPGRGAGPPDDRGPSADKGGNGNAAGNGERPGIGSAPGKGDGPGTDRASETTTGERGDRAPGKDDGSSADRGHGTDGGAGNGPDKRSGTPTADPGPPDDTPGGGTDTGPGSDTGGERDTDG